MGLVIMVCFQTSTQSPTLVDGELGNEKEAGEGLQRAIKDGLVKREDVFVTTKLWATFHSP
jgi:hypothetical protein